MTKLTLLAAIAFLVLGCRQSPSSPSSWQDTVESLRKSLNNEAQLNLYEGLPHQFYEAEVLTSELRSKKTIELNGYPFYEEALPLKAEDQEKIVALIKSDQAFKPRNADATKTCGGYHPDYCLEWKHEGNVCRLQICFGCYEAKWFGPKAEVYCDIDEAYHPLAKILKPYRKNRPAPSKSR